MTIKSFLLNDRLLGRRKKRGVSGMAATWAIAGLLGFTNLGVAAAQGFAQPLSKGAGASAKDPKLLSMLKSKKNTALIT